MALSFLGPQNTIPTTKIQISMVRRPIQGGPGVHKKRHKNEAKQGLRGGKQPQTPK